MKKKIKKPEVIYIDPNEHGGGNWGRAYSYKAGDNDIPYISLDLVKQMIEHIELANDVVKKLNKLVKN